MCFCLTAVFASCSIFTSKPSGTLSESEMAEVIVDIHLTEASLQVANDSNFRLNDTTGLRIKFAQVFNEHDVTPDDFNTSLNYYMEHIDELDKIYIEVISILTEMEASLLKKQPERAGVKMPGKLMDRYPSATLNNQWFKMMNPPPATEAVQYFAPSVYPIPAK